MKVLMEMLPEPMQLVKFLKLPETIRCYRKSLHKGIEKAVIGNRLFDISHAVQKFVESNGFSVVRDYVGHGIGRDMHEDPQVPNFWSSR